MQTVTEQLTATIDRATQALKVQRQSCAVIQHQANEQRKLAGNVQQDQLIRVLNSLSKLLLVDAEKMQVQIELHLSMLKQVK